MRRPGRTGREHASTNSPEAIERDHAHQPPKYMLEGRQTQFYIDIIYGIVFAAGFGALLWGGMDIRIAAFQVGLVLGYFLRVWENMSAYERILREEVAAEAEEAVAEEAEAAVAEEAEHAVAAEAEQAVADEAEDAVAAEAEAAVADEAREAVSDEVEAQVADEIAARIKKRVKKEVSQQIDEEVQARLSTIAGQEGDNGLRSDRDG